MSYLFKLLKFILIYSLTPYVFHMQFKFYDMCPVFFGESDLGISCKIMKVCIGL